MGFAYNANYFRWFEIGRTELLRSFGLTYKAIETKGLFLPVSEAFCKYIAPVIDATAAIAIDLNSNKTLFEKNIHEKNIHKSAKKFS